jgi:hypothetical protein
MSKYPNQMEYSLCAVVFKDLKQEELSDETERIYTIVKYMKSLNLKTNQLGI